MADRDEGFGQRWSRRKSAARSPIEAESKLEDSPEQPPPSTGDRLDGGDTSPPNADQSDEKPPVRPEDLPSIDSLTAESDYTPFLQEGVPDALRKAALRKLWRSNPVLANVDGLNDYDEDFARMGLGKVVNTAFEIGKGMVRRIEAEADEAADAADEDATAPDAEATPSTKDA